MKPASKYRKGVAAEYRTMRLYEAMGYGCIRAAGSHGPFDIVAMDRSAIRLIQVKSGGAKMSKDEYEKVLDWQAPATAIKELVEWRDRVRTPTITRIG